MRWSGILATTVSNIVQCCQQGVLCVQALLPTRRWFNTLLDDSHLVVSCHLSSLAHREKEGHLFCQVQHTGVRVVYALEMIVRLHTEMQTN